MKTSKVLILVVISTLLWSCTHPANPEDPENLLTWETVSEDILTSYFPYAEGDTVVFESEIGLYHAVICNSFCTIGSMSDEPNDPGSQGNLLYNYIQCQSYFQILELQEKSKYYEDVRFLIFSADPYGSVRKGYFEASINMLPRTIDSDLMDTFYEGTSIMKTIVNGTKDPNRILNLAYQADTLILYATDDIYNPSYKQETAMIVRNKGIVYYTDSIKSGVNRRWTFKEVKKKQ